jgi:ATP-dependent Clp protease adaptor protein ClpS
MSTDLEEKTKSRQQLTPKYKVLLHNDDINSCDYVVVCLIKTVNTLSPEKAVAIMWEAHNTGIGLVTVVPLEMAEFYCEMLKEYGLTSTIEPE